MFENILGQQEVIGRLSRDISSSTLPPSILFAGPPASGKGSAALELARILSCEDPAAPWNCSCYSCSHHRSLSQPDLLLLGPRSFSAEVSAASAAFLRDSGVPGAKLLFTRSVRKLLARFSPVFLEDDPKTGKLSSHALSSLIQNLDEELTEVETGSAPEEVEKLCASILKNAFKLEAEGMGDLIPVAYLRRAAYWSRLAPQGRRKFLIIENADRMKDEGRNSLLKILEEPPPTLTIVFVTTHETSLLPTIRSRLRPYRFARRDAASETDVIRRVFRDNPERLGASPSEAAPQLPAEHAAQLQAQDGKGLVCAYLESFLPVSAETLHPIAALFAASVAMGAAAALRRRNLPLPETLTCLGKHCAPIAEAAGFGRPIPGIGPLVAKMLSAADRFTTPDSFNQFLNALLSLVSESLTALPGDPGVPACRDIWSKKTAEAASSSAIYNLTPAMVLDRLGTELRQAMVSQIKV
jgi:DNA polymerase-3 subunit gamma/tau